MARPGFRTLYGGEPLNYLKTISFLLFFLTATALSAKSSKMSADQHSVLEDSRAYALQYVERLPDFICTQITHRDVGIRAYAAGDMTNTVTKVMRQTSDTIEEQLTYSRGKESYKILTLDGKKDPGADHATLTGAISWGEFGSLFAQIFDPASHTTFEWSRVERVQGRQLWAYKYHVPKASGATVIDAPIQSALVVAYSGRVVIDPETKDIVEISSDLEIPATFPIHNVTRRIAYADKDIGGKKYCLPSHADMHMEEGRRVFDNQIDFNDYHHFMSESTIHFGEEVAH